MLGSAFAQLLDRMLRAPGVGRGKVGDFIDHNGWFIGNVADIALVTGAVTLDLLLTTGREPLTWSTLGGV